MSALNFPHVMMSAQDAGATIRRVDSNTSASTRELIAARGANMRIGIISAIIANTGSTNNVLVTLKSGSTSIAHVYVPTETTAIASFGVDAPMWLNANEDLDWTTDAASTTVYITVHGLVGGNVNVVTA